jgi:hypothetical protein
MNSVTIGAEDAALTYLGNNYRDTLVGHVLCYVKILSLEIEVVKIKGCTVFVVPTLATAF